MTSWLQMTTGNPDARLCTEMTSMAASEEHVTLLQNKSSMEGGKFRVKVTLLVTSEAKRDVVEIKTLDQLLIKVDGSRKLALRSKRLVSELDRRLDSGLLRYEMGSHRSKQSHNYSEQLMGWVIAKRPAVEVMMRCKRLLLYDTGVLIVMMGPNLGK